MKGEGFYNVDSFPFVGADRIRPFFHIDSPPENLPASAHCADFIAAGDFIREADFICRWQISLRISLP